MYTEEQRRVFPYECPPGTGVLVHADPLAAHFDLIEHTEGRLSEAWAVWSDPDADALQRAAAGKDLVVAARFAFALPEFCTDDGTGCTDSDALRILEEYFRWCEGKDYRPDPSPTSVASSGRSSDPSITTPCSDCG